jgi:hypothetical protein
VAMFLRTVWGTTVTTLGEARGFIHDVDVPHTLISDNAKATVLHSPWQNLAEASMRELKKSVRCTIRRTGTPLWLWPYFMEWCVAVQRITASNIPQLNGRTTTKYADGSTPDIS